MSGLPFERTGVGISIMVTMAVMGARVVPLTMAPMPIKTGKARPEPTPQ